MYVSMLLTQGVLPVCLLLWQGWVKSYSRVGWLLKTLLVAAYLAAVSMTGMWPVFLTWWMPYLYWLIWFATIVLTYRSMARIALWPKRNIWGVTKILFCGGVAGFFVFYSLQAATGYILPDAQPIPLDFPLRNGHYSVLSGGNQMLMSSNHIKTLKEEKFQSYRGQSYEIDLVKLNQFGSRTVGLLPKDLEQYEIFGESAYAPCDGSVVSAFNDAPDMIPPNPDREHMLGNHVLLRCADADVLLAHFQQGSVTVQKNDAIATGHLLGKVGNSGNSNEPHLHIHAQRPGREFDPLNADPLPLLFNNRYLVRNSRIVDRSAKTNRSELSKHL